MTYNVEGIKVGLQLSRLGRLEVPIYNRNPLKLTQFIKAKSLKHGVALAVSAMYISLWVFLRLKCKKAKLIIQIQYKLWTDSQIQNRRSDCRERKAKALSVTLAGHLRDSREITKCFLFDRQPNHLRTLQNETHKTHDCINLLLTLQNF